MRPDLPDRIKLVRFVRRILLYGSETWSLTMDNKLNTCENRWLRQILCIKYTDRVSNVEVRVTTGQEIAENTVRKRRMKWYRHISRMNKERWPSVVHNWKPTGKRPVGRPLQRWMDNIEKDLKELVCHCMALPQDETELDSRSWLETEKGGRTSLQHPWPDGPLG